MKKLLTGTVILLLITFAACRKEHQSADTDNPSASTTSDKQLYNALLSAGIKESQIEDRGEFYIVWGELLFRKGNTNLEQVKAYFKRGNITGPQEEQQHTFNLVNTNIVQSIRVRVDYSLFHTWEFPTRLAMQDWANISNCKVNFHYVSDLTEPIGNEDIRVLPDGGTLPEDVIAGAEFPNASGNTGWRIRINTNFWDQPGQYVHPNNRGYNMWYNMVHEIGHAIGLLHTNWAALNEFPGQQVPGTPGYSGDANSVMNGGTALNLWNGFSSYDIIAAQYLYPYSALDNWITAPQEDFNANLLTPIRSYEGFDINWNPNLVNTPTVTLQLYRHRNLLGTIASGVPNTGSFYFNEGHYNSFFPPMSDASGVQVRIVSDADPSQSDFSAMFFINWE